MVPSKNTWRTVASVAASRPGEQLPPPPGGVGVGHIDGLGIERDLPRPQPGDGGEAPGAIGIDLEE